MIERAFPHTDGPNDSETPANDKQWQRTKPALSVMQVYAIRRQRENNRGISLTALANEYGVSVGTIRDALYGEGAYRGI